MTNEERVISLLGFAPSDKNSIEGALLDVGISADGEYNSSLAVDIKKCAIQLMYLILTTPDTTNDTGGIVIKYDRDAILKRIAVLENEIETPEVVVPTIRSPKVW